MSELRIVALGDVVGRPGRRAVRELLPRLRDAEGCDDANIFVVINAENSAGGSGVTLATAGELIEAGADVLTTGDHFFEQRDVNELIDAQPRVLRPLNWSHHAPGIGYGIFDGPSDTKIGVINLIGRTFMRVVPDNFFDAIDEAIEEIRAITPIVVVDFHAEATSEKVALGRYVDGRASMVVGTHTHIQTSDEKILPGGTAYITDLGMCGPHDSVLGRDTAAVTKRLKTGIPARFNVAKKDIRLQGVVVTVETSTGIAKNIERVDLPLEV